MLSVTASGKREKSLECRCTTGFGQMSTRNLPMKQEREYFPVRGAGKESDVRLIRRKSGKKYATPAELRSRQKKTVRLL
ncbi:hypothetical protein NDN08_006576 [Rhodosorus marinus]|uniref:Uncharacterized protein n=1 Tax=Rhodosorus marinus TaxID=101924 RepID=A0AAV8UM39_9RHOD|nr:hypothetical protein NDN08_006576 [Rhodosorus marinus]